MTLKQMIARVNRALTGIAPGRIGEPDIVDMLNDAQRELAKQSTKVTEKEIEVDKNQEKVPFPDDLLILSTVLWSDERRELMEEPTRMPERDFGDPRFYYIENGQILFHPVPNRENTVHIVYKPEPEALKEDEDTPYIEGAGNYMVAYTLHRIHLENGTQVIGLWENEKYKELISFLDGEDQNYYTPFRVPPRW